MSIEATSTKETTHGKHSPFSHGNSIYIVEEASKIFIVKSAPITSYYRALSCDSFYQNRIQEIYHFAALHIQTNSHLIILREFLRVRKDLWKYL